MDCWGGFVCGVRITGDLERSTSNGKLSNSQFAPENGCSEDAKPSFGDGSLAGAFAMLVSGRV